MRRGAAVLVWLCVACGESLPPGKCRVDADCVSGESCGTPGADGLGSCGTSDAACASVCGEGLECRSTGGVVTACVLPAGRTFGLRLVSPSDGQQSGPAGASLQCENAGVTAERVFFELSGPVGATKTVAGIPDGTFHAVTWPEPGDAAADGTWRVRCVAERGPEGKAAREETVEVSFALDRTPPGRPIHRAPTAWFGAGATATLDVDLSPSGPDVYAVQALFGTHPFVAPELAGANTKITVALDDLLTGPHEGPLPYVLETIDTSGNIDRTEAFSLKVDTVPRSASLVLPAGWVGVGVVEAGVRASGQGAPVAADGVRVEWVESPAIAFDGPGGGDSSQVDVDTARFATAGEERGHGLRARVVDEAGNVATSEVAFLQVDAKGPVVTWSGEHDWFRPGSVAQLRFSVGDAGAGVDAASVVVTAGGRGTTCTRPSSDGWSCAVDTQGVSASATEYPVRIEARDLAGNVTVRQVAVKLDGTGPVVAASVDERYLGASRPVTLDLSIEDAGAGLDLSRPPTLQFSGAAAVEGVELGGGLFRFGPVTGRALLGLTGDTLELGLGGTVTATDLAGNVSQSIVYRNADFQPPTGTVVSTTYPAAPVAPSKLLRREFDPQFLAQGRRDRLLVNVRFEDTFTTAGGAPRSSGLDPATAVLTYPKASGGEARVTGTLVGNFEYAFTFDASDAAFTGPQVQSEGTVALRFTLQDQAGNPGGPTLPVTVTREPRDREIHTASAPAAGGIALGASFGYVAASADSTGTTASNVRRFHFSDGSSQGAARVPGIPFGTPVVGRDFVWVTSRNGGQVVVSGVRPEFTTDASPLFSCPFDATSAGVPALVDLAWPSGGTAETFVLPLSSGKVLFLRGTGCGGIVDPMFGAMDLSTATVAVRAGTAYVSLPDGRVARSTLAATPESSFLSAPVFAPAQAGSAPVAGVALGATKLFFASGTQPWFADASLAAPLAVPTTGVLWEANLAPVYSGDSEGLLAAGSRLMAFAESGTPGLDRLLTDLQGALVHATTTPLVTDSPRGRVTYVATNEPRLLALDAAGTVLWSKLLPAGLAGAPKLGCSGVLYLATTNGRLILLVTDSTSVARTPWPAWQHDGRNTGNAATALDACAP